MQNDHPLKTYRASQIPPMRRASLARLLKVSKTTIARWEKGIRKIDEDLVPFVSKETGIPAKELRPDLFQKREALFGEVA